MRAPILSLIIAAGLVAASSAEAAKPAVVCPQIHRTPVTRLSQLPPVIRRELGAIAELNGRWNAGDAIGPGEARYPFRHLMAAGDMGRGRWLVVWEQGGIAHFDNVVVYRLFRTPAGRTEAKVVARGQNGALAVQCAQVAAALR